MHGLSYLMTPFCVNLGPFRACLVFRRPPLVLSLVQSCENAIRMCKAAALLRIESSSGESNARLK